MIGGWVMEKPAGRPVLACDGVGTGLELRFRCVLDGQIDDHHDLSVCFGYTEYLGTNARHAPRLDVGRNTCGKELEP